MRRKRITNKQIIQKLLPHLKEAIRRKDQIEFTKKDFYGYPMYDECIPDEDFGEIRIIWTLYDGVKEIRVFVPLKGKYDCAKLIWREGEDCFGYAKEYTGMGNGYYADVDFNGRIIRRECD